MLKLRLHASWLLRAMLAQHQPRPTRTRSLSRVRTWELTVSAATQHHSRGEGVAGLCKAASVTWATGPAVPCSSMMRFLGMQAPQILRCSAVGAASVTHVIVGWVALHREELVSASQVVMLGIMRK